MLMLKQVLTIASGSQVYNGICADFPQANKAKAAAEIQYIFKSVAPAIAVLK
jgi:hypothetical protein